MSDDWRKRLLEVAKDIEFVLTGRTTKSINEIVREYDSALNKFAFDTLQGRMSEKDMRQAHKSLLRKLGPEVYYEGMHEAGIEEPDKNLTELDETQIEKWIEAQIERVAGFAEWLTLQNNDEFGRRLVSDRVDLWVQALDSFGAQGKASAEQDEMCEWEWDERIEKHCATCEKLNGSRHRVSWFIKRNYIPQKPGAGMKCGGFNCGCVLRNIKTGKVVLP